MSLEDREALARRIEGHLGPFNFITAQDRALVLEALRAPVSDAPSPSAASEPSYWIIPGDGADMNGFRPDAEEV